MIALPTTALEPATRKASRKKKRDPRTPLNVEPLEARIAPAGVGLSVTKLGSTALSGGTASSTLASGANVTLNSNGTFTYVSAAGQAGSDSFTYTIQDKGLDGIAGNADDLTSVGTVSIGLTGKIWYVDN